MAGVRRFALVLAVLPLALSCNNNLATALQDKVIAGETEPPVAGGGLTAGTPRATVIPLSWTKATDSLSPAADLEYKVVWSPRDDIGSVAEADSNGTTAVDWTVDIGSADVAGLSILTTCHMNVLVRDRAGNTAAYSSVSATTTDDTTNPSPADPSTLQLDTSQMDALIVSWTRGTDDLTPQTALTYQVYTSKDNSLLTIGDTLTYGTPFGTPEANISARTVSGLDDQVTYHVNVVIRDEKGNQDCYTAKSGTTIKHPRIYWIERANHRIRRADLDGSNPGLVYDTGVGTAPFVLAIDPVHRQLYYTQQNSPQAISRVDFNGTNRVDLITSNVTTPRGIALDVAGEMVYWTDYANDKIYAAPFSTVGGNAEDFDILTLTTGCMANGIALDLVSTPHMMYWTEEGGAAGLIRKAELNGANPATAYTNVDSAWPRALSIDVAAGYLYFTTKSILYIGRVKTDGNFFNAIITTNVYAPAGVAIDITNSNVYWTDITPHLIYRAPSSTLTGNASLFNLGIDTSNGSPTGIAVY
jgi:hypothetical protein